MLYNLSLISYFSKIRFNYIKIYFLNKSLIRLFTKYIFNDKLHIITFIDSSKIDLITLKCFENKL